MALLTGAVLRTTRTGMIEAPGVWSPLLLSNNPHLLSLVDLMDCKKWLEELTSEGWKVTGINLDEATGRPAQRQTALGDLHGSSRQHVILFEYTIATA